MSGEVLPSYESVKCELSLPGCKRQEAGYLRRETYATVGPWLNACEPCARVPYEQPKQFQEAQEVNGVKGTQS